MESFHKHTLVLVINILSCHCNRWLYTGAYENIKYFISLVEIWNAFGGTNSSMINVKQPCKILLEIGTFKLCFWVGMVTINSTSSLKVDKWWGAPCAIRQTWAMPKSRTCCYREPWNTAVCNQGGLWNLPRGDLKARRSLHLSEMVK